MDKYHIKHRLDGKRGIGTIADPFNGNEFDWAISEIKRLKGYDTPVAIKIGEGTFSTIGFAPAKNWVIRGSGMRKTTLKLQDVGLKSFHHPDVHIISTAWYGGFDPAWAETITVSDMTLDCDWSNQGGRQTQYVKYAGVHASCTRGLIERIRVINWGSNGVGKFHSEVFPISLQTYSDEGTYAVIQDCIVEKQFQYEGGYSTAINIVTTRPEGGDRIPWNTRKSRAGVVRRNRAYGIYGHGFGCGHAENVLFEDNVAVDCKSGFNCDTGLNRNIVIRKNSFVHCVQGIHSGNMWNGGFTNFVIMENDFHVTEKWFNAWLEPQMYEYSYGVRIGGNTKGFKILRNSFLCLKGVKSLIDGSYGVGTAADSDIEFEIKDNRFEGFKDEIVLKAPVYL